MCEFCELRDPLDSLAEKWLFDYPVNLNIAQVNFGAVIFPSRKQLDISVVSSPVIDREILTEHININYCPMCGRELIEGEEPMTLERFLGMYDGSCLISVMRGAEQLCAVQELAEIKRDLWYEECRSSIVTTFKIVSDDYEKGSVILLITVK